MFKELACPEHVVNTKVLYYNVCKRLSRSPQCHSTLLICQLLGHVQWNTPTTLYTYGSECSVKGCPECFDQYKV